MDKHGGNIYEYSDIRMDFSVNLSPLGMPEEIKRAIINSVSECEVYPDTKQRKLREDIASFYTEKLKEFFICNRKDDKSDTPKPYNAHRIEANQIVCGSGAADLILRIPPVIKTRGGSRRALIVAPAFSEYEEALNRADFDIEFYYSKKENGYRIEEDLIDRVESDDYDLVFICNPANPTGVSVDESIMVRLIEACGNKDTYLVVDECFLELTDEEGKLTVIPFVLEEKNLMVLRSFTKTYAMAGLRLGYILCGDRDIAKLLLESGQPWAVSKPAEIAGLAALGLDNTETENAEETYIFKTREIIRAERIRLCSLLTELGMDVVTPSANFIFFFGPWALDDKLKEKGYLIRNCENYEGINPPKNKGAYRIAIRMPRENNLLMEAIRESL